MSQIDGNYRPQSLGPTGGTDETGDKPVRAGSTSGDVQGAGGTNQFGGARPTLPAPSMSPTAMMIALTALQSKQAEEGIKFGEKAMDGVRKDIKESGAKKVEELKKYFDNLERASSKRCGFFGLVAKFFKALFTGDWQGVKEAAKDIGSVLKDIVQIVAVVLAVAAAAVMGGPGLMALAVVGAALVIAGMVMSDPGITEMILEALPEDQRQAAAIALAVVGAILAIAGSICSGKASGVGTAIAAISKLATIASTLISAGVTVDQGVKGYQAAEHKAESMRNMAQIDKTEALMEELKSTLDRSQKDLKAMFDAFSSALSSTKDMITQYGQNQSRAASV